jgi:hypothetical protein
MEKKAMRKKCAKKKPCPPQGRQKDVRHQQLHYILREGDANRLRMGLDEKDCPKTPKRCSTPTLAEQKCELERTAAAEQLYCKTERLKDA